MASNQFIGAHIIDIDNLGPSQNEKLAKRDSSPLINKLELFHEKDKKAYEPTNFSFGPYHYWTPELHAMEKIKWTYLNYILELNHERKLQDYIEAMYQLEKKARSCYANEIKMDRKRFVEMLLLDGCFILVIFNGIDGLVSDFNKSIEGTNIKMDQTKDQAVIDVGKNNQNEGSHEKDEDSYFEMEQFYTKYLVRDVLLLENQIPFFVIIKIHELVAGGQNKSLLMKNVFESMKHVLDCYPNAIQESDRPKELHHLLHICHMHFQPSQRGAESYQTHVRPLPFHHFLTKFIKKNTHNLSCHHDRAVKPSSHWRRVTQYREARIELQKRVFRAENPHSLLDIKFYNGTLEIPFFNIDQEYCDLFWNLVAFEQTSPQFGNDITAYVVFWSQFIRTTDDVVFLVDKGIIRHHLNSDKEASDLFRSLGDDINFDFNSDYYLKSICNRMEEHYEIWRPRWREWPGSITSSFPTFARKDNSELPITLSQGNTTGC